jgi:hypothetical protein
VKSWSYFCSNFGGHSGHPAHATSHLVGILLQNVSQEEKRTFAKWKAVLQVAPKSFFLLATFVLGSPHQL